MAGKEFKTSIWALDPEIKLSDIPSLLNLNYNKPIKYLQDEEDLTIEDKTLLNHWKAYNLDEGFNIQSFNFFEEEINFISANAYFETAAPKDDAIINDLILPRNKRVKDYILPVFFFEDFEKVYVITIGSDYKTNNIRTALMGNGRATPELKERWKKVQFKNIPNYTFDSNFFYWLINKQGNTIEIDNYEIDISDIRFLAHTAVRRTDIQHESQGANILDEATSKTSLGVNSNVGKIGTTLSFDEGHIHLIIFANGHCSIDNYQSTMNGTNGELEPFENNLEKGLLILYKFILPALRTSFNTEKLNNIWTVGLQSDARKFCALGAINELCAENNISIREVEELEWFYSK